MIKRTNNARVGIKNPRLGRLSSSKVRGALYYARLRRFARIGTYSPNALWIRPYSENQKALINALQLDKDDAFTNSSGNPIKVWLDADHASSITRASDLASSWGDLSGFDNHAVQAVELGKPTYTLNSVGGKPSLVFSNDNFLSIAHNAGLNFDSGTGFTIFLVVNFDGFANQGSSLNVMLSKGAAQLASATYNIQTNSGNGFWVQTGNNELVLNSGGAINGSAKLLSCVMNNSTTRADSYIGGATKTSNLTATVSSNNSSALIIGGDTGAVRYASGKYAELIICNRFLTDTERAAIEAYLISKWSL